VRADEQWRRGGIPGRGFGKDAQRNNPPTYVDDEDCKQRIPIRLIVYRLPSGVYRKRQKAAIKAAKRKERSRSLSYLKFLKYRFFITNVPATLWSKEAVGTVHRLRWQEELVFKNWKSLLLINVLKVSRPERILCLIYGRLIAILVEQCMFALASAQAAAEQR
jgi:hypothetical protein